MGRAGMFSRSEKIGGKSGGALHIMDHSSYYYFFFFHYLLLLHAPYGCDDTRVYGCLFWERGLHVLAPPVSGLGRECAEFSWIVSVWGSITAL